jgi:predicted aconitase
MYLTKFEEEMLNGEYGYARALALKVIVRVGEALGAQELVEVSHAHISGISYLNIGDAGLEFIEDIVNAGGTAYVFTSANPYMVLSDFLGCKHDDKVINKQLRIINTLNRLGVKFYTCVPYNVRPPRYGEHLAWAESNAVLYANSVLGALSNKEGGPLALLAAITGRTYKSGVHLRDNRRPEVLFNVKVLDGVDLGFLGLVIGELTGSKIPYISNLRFRCTYELKQFLAALGTTSNTPIAIIQGVTPDYKELIDGVEFEEVYDLGSESIKSYVKVFKENVLNGNGLYLVGCPHLSFNELVEFLRRAVGIVESGGSSIDVRGRELWITTYEGFLNDEVIKLVDKLSKYNVKVIVNGCAVVSRLDSVKVDYVVTDSVKASSYISRLSKIPTLVLPRDDLLSMYFLKKINLKLV